jgi:multidrug efflux system membrane fusion protein
MLVKSRVDGQIMKINFSEGQDVHAGDVLVEIDPRPYQAALNQAQANKLRDQALLENARLDLNRSTRLAVSGTVSTQQLDTARALVKQLEASVESGQAMIDSAQVNLDCSRIRSPLDGRAGTRLIDAGNMVKATDSGGRHMGIGAVRCRAASGAAAPTDIRRRLALIRRCGLSGYIGLVGAR